jgi:hypothetical protein
MGQLATFAPPWPAARGCQAGACSPAMSSCSASASRRPGAAGRLFTVLDADLTLIPVGGQALMRLHGACRPPLAGIGAAADQIVLHRAAPATLRSLLTRIAGAVTSAAPAAVNATRPRRQFVIVRPGTRELPACGWQWLQPAGRCDPPDRRSRRHEAPPRSPILGFAAGFSLPPATPGEAALLLATAGGALASPRCRRSASDRHLLEGRYPWNSSRTQGRPPGDQLGSCRRVRCRCLWFRRRAGGRIATQERAARPRTPRAHCRPAGIPA